MPAPPSADHQQPKPGAGAGRWGTRHGFAAFYWLSLVVAFTGLRAVLVLRFHGTMTASAGEVARAFLIGLPRDLLVATLGTLPLLAWYVVVPPRWFGRAWHRRLFVAGFFVFWLVEVFLLAVEFYFFDEFHSRFNTVAVDYLLFPQETFVNIWDSYPVVAVLAVCATLSAGWLALAHWWFAGMWSRPVSRWPSAAWTGVALAVVATLAPTISLKGTQFSQERALNEVANNGVISFLAAYWTRHLDYSAFYLTLPRAEAWRRAQRLLAQPGTTFLGEGDTVRRRVAGDPARPRLNVVLLLAESFGSEFWGSLGRPKATCTPEMDRLAQTAGLLFTNIYASGNRTVRGFEGLLSSFPPLPGDAIVARDRSDNVETIARVLRRDGYQTLFVYGGRGVFDGMRSFALRNGYDRFVEQKDFPKPTFATIWGVCDEDIYARAVAEFRALAASGKPFLGTVLSVSNHKPYTYPKGRIAENPDARRRKHAVKYSDYALGQFFKAARAEPFWTNTVFVVVADHGARVYGSQSIPIHSYEIPLLIAGPAVVRAPARLGQLGCSLDVAPTVLGLIGRPYDTLFFGRDLLRGPADEGRVFIHHNRDIGLYTRERLVVLGLRQTLELYQGDPKVTAPQRLVRPGETEQELARDAQALFQVADELYLQERYRLDP
jgi:phosphoglycerol transferase MdoB-like AlkP superfamily enzyme